MTVDLGTSDTKGRFGPVAVALVFLFLLLVPFPLTTGGRETPAEAPYADRAPQASAGLLQGTMWITKTAPISVTPGNLITYTISWLISGTMPVNSVAITDGVPMGTTFWEANPPAASEPAVGETGVELGRSLPESWSPIRGGSAD